MLHWMEQMLTPCAIMPVYGYLWWLNTGRREWPAASERAYAAIGACNQDDFAINFRIDHGYSPLPENPVFMLFGES